MSSFKNLLSATEATTTQGGGEGHGGKGTGNAFANAFAKIVIEKGEDRKEKSRQGADGGQSEGETGDKVFLTTLQPQI